MRTIGVALLAVMLAAAPAAGQQPRFEGRIVTEWIDDPTGPDREMLVLEPFAFVDAGGLRWEVPAGTTVNGASIPQILWWTGSPFVGDYRNASVVHDYYCQARTRPSRDVHRMFYRALLASDVPELTAKIFYGFVYYLGPKWDRVHPTALTALRSRQELERLRKSIEENDLTLDQIENFFGR